LPSETAVSLRLTVAGALERATRRFAEAGLAAPRREAVRLLADLLECSAPSVWLERERVIEPERRRWIDRAVDRRALGEPLGYVTGVAGFRQLLLRVDRRVLIPRPETEGLVDRVLGQARGGVVVDVGTGSGCIALALRQEGDYRAVVALDRSADALAVARLNAHRLGLDGPMIRGDLATAVATESIDALVSNPPYVSAAEYQALDGSVRDFEPRLALESGSDGLEATRALLVDGWRVVRPGGLVAIEIAADRATAVVQLAREAGWNDIVVDNDMFGRARYLLGRKDNGGGG
jgi:release factor glutamine methyltransferase